MRMNQRERKPKRNKKMVQFSPNISVAKVDGPNLTIKKIVRFLKTQLHALYRISTYSIRTQEK